MSESNIRVRPMERSDFEALRPIMRELHAVHSEARPDYYLPEDDPLTPEIFDFWFGEDMHPLVAEMDGEVVGYVTPELQRRVGNYVRPMLRLHIHDVAVAEKARRRGVGRALFREAERLGRSLGASRIQLSVWAFNTAAREFYASLGFEVRTLNLDLVLE